MGIRDWLGLAPISKASFLKTLFEEAQRRAPHARFTYDSSADEITVTTDKDWSMEAQSHFIVYTQTPSRLRRQVLGELADNILYQGYDPPFDEVADFLRPVVHNLSTVLNSKQRALAHRPFGPLTLGLAIYRPGYDRFVSRDLLASWGMELDAALARAFHNLAVADPSANFVERDGVYITDYHDLYDSSRLFMPEVLAQLPIDGDPVAVVVSRRCLCVTSGDNVESLRALARIAGDLFLSEPFQLGTAPLVRRGEGWQALEPLEGQPPELADLRAVQLRWDYELQRSELDARNEREGADIYVSEVYVWGHNGSLLLATSWSPRIPTQLAQTDVVFLPCEGDDAIIRTFADFETACGPFEPEPESYPIRYRVVTPPSAQAIDRLATEFSEP
jgi:hypothetical protein